MRFCLAQTSTPRGAGLGNELFGWAKAFLASRVLDAEVIHPAFGLNRRRYQRAFGTSRFDWVGQKLLRASLPVIDFGEDEYRATGRDDFEEAVAAFAVREGLLDRGSYVLTVGGMWGGFLAIRKARTFVTAELLNARNVLTNLHSMLRDRDPETLLVAVHVRRGDFDAPDDADYRVRFNIALPLDWYERTCEAIATNFPGRVRFVIVTDADEASVRPFVERFDALTTFHLRDTTCSDLMLMAMADAIVCSVSSYSLWGAFLSDAPYFWFAPNLHRHGERGSLWGNEPAERNGGPTDRHLQMLLSSGGEDNLPRGIPVGRNGEVPHWAGELLASRLRPRSVATDLIYSGLAPLPSTQGDGR